MKNILLLLISGMVILMSCSEVNVFYPVPLKTGAKFLVVARGGSFDDSLFINTDSIFGDLGKVLEERDLTLEDLDRIKLEGAAYTIYDPTNPDAAILGTLSISYCSSIFENIITLDNLVLADIEGKPQVNALTPDGVLVLDRALQDIKNGISGRLRWE
ncbi:MAG: hypothetical protein P8Y60_07100 [Calditrichota bacterium]|jgi:hypothetical protein